MQFNYIIRPRAFQKNRTFYRNVALKYRHTYSYDDMVRDAQDAFYSIYRIEDTLPRRKPTIDRWAGYYMANTERWYYAYCIKIKDDTIIVVDACHAQNMHN